VSFRFLDGMDGFFQIDVFGAHEYCAARFVGKAAATVVGNVDVDEAQCVYQIKGRINCWIVCGMAC
jgi:hypothetical protein